MRRGAVLLASLAACGGIDRDVGGYVTIKQGVYGQVVGQSDVAGAEASYAPGIRVTLVSEAGGETLGPSVTNEEGFYEIAAPAGSHQICGSWVGSGGDWCQRIDLPIGLRRVNGTIGGGLFWYYAI